jgi:Beta-lactamase
MFHLHDHLADQKQILSDEQIDELHRPVIRVREDRSYGAGWMIGRAFDGTTVVYHTGNQAGVVTLVMLLPSRDISCVVLTNHDDDHDLVARIRDAALRTLVPDWTWKSLPSPPVQPLTQAYRGTWRGKVHDGDNEISVALSIADQGSTLQIGSQKPEPISQLGLVEGVLIGTARGKLEFPVARAAQAEGLSLRLQLRGARLAGEIGTEVPIPRTAVPGHLPFWAELSVSSAPSASSRPAPTPSASPAPR